MCYISSVNDVTIRCSVYNFPELTFLQLVKSSQQSILSDNIPTLSDLIFNPMSRPQLGSFKKAQFGRMNDLITLKSRPVCIKQCIHREQNADTFKSPIMVYDSCKQAELLMMEINCTRWAAALMGVVYTFIEAECRIRGHPPFNIPKMKFVPVALAIAQNDKRDTYLIEDIINAADDGEFTKYINNNSAKPLVFRNNEERTGIAAFLAFAQHVQYHKTQQLAFVSDFQGRDDPFLSMVHYLSCYSLTGGRNLLTDPQIITSPYVHCLCNMFPSLGWIFFTAPLGVCFQMAT